MKSNVGKLWRKLILIFVFMLPVYVMAQAKPDSGHKALKTRARFDSSRALLKTRMDSTRFLIDSLIVRLTLTPEQETKIREILKINREQTAMDRELYQGFPQAGARANKERFDKTDKEIFALLDAEQRKKYELLKKDFFTRKEAQKKKAKAKPTSTP